MAYFVINYNDREEEFLFDESVSFEKNVSEKKEIGVSKVSFDDSHEQKTENKELRIPFKHFIVADGVVIPSSDYIKINPTQTGLVKKVCIKVGDFVQKGQVLYEVDDSMLQTKLLEKRASVLSASAKFEEICVGAHPFEIEMKEKEVQKAGLELSLKEKESDLFKDLFEKNAVSQAEKNEQDSILRMKELEYAKIKASLSLLKTGPSQSQKKIYEALLQEKMAELQMVNQKIQGCTIKAPISGVILDSSLRVGQNVEPVVMGKTDPLFIRALVDEKDAWRLLPNSSLRAIAISKSNPNIQFVLNFQRISPLLKRSQAGVNTLEVLFSFEKHHAPVYLEQNFDIYIQAVSQKDTACLEYQFQSLGK